MGRRTLGIGRCLGVLLCCAAMLMLATSCQQPAQRDSEIKPAAITDVEGYVEMIARRRENEIRSKVSSARTKSEETIFEETLGLKLDGYIYHPNLVEYTLGGVFGLLQFDFERVDDDRRFSSSDDGHVNEFDLEGRFFKKKKYPGSAFARRYESLEARPFQSSLRTTTGNYGFVWQYVDEVMPTSIQFDHTDVQIDPLSSEEDEGRQRNTTFRFETAYRFTDSNTLALTYDHKRVREAPFDFHYDSDEVRLTHRLDFGDRKRHSLQSEVNYFDQRGTFDVERFRWIETLRLRHTKKLRSIIQGEYLDRTQGVQAGVEPIEEKSYYVSATLEHELYESLTSQIFVWAQTQDFDSGPQIDRYGGQASFDYRKKNPFGKLIANYRIRLQREDRSGGDRDVDVFEERRTFNDPNPIVLQIQNIRVSSIRITSEDRLTLYINGSDFRVTPYDDRVEIDRVPTGRIDDGETVLVSYVFTLASDFTLDTTTHQIGVRQDFDCGFSPYYRFRHQDQTLSPEDAAGGIEDDITSNLLGLEYRYEGLRLSAEYEDHDSTITPFDALRFTADYRHRFKFGGTGSIRARWSDINRRAPQDRDTKFFTLEGRYRHPIVKGLTVEGAVIYRHEEDSLSGDDEGIDVDLTLEWFIRQTEIRLMFEYGEYEDDFAESDDMGLYLQVRRKF